MNKFPLELEMQAKIDSFGRTLFNLGSASLPYTVFIVGKQADGFDPTVELDKYLGIIYCDNQYHVYTKKLVINELDEEVYKNTRVSSHYFLMQAIEDMFGRLVHMKMQEFINQTFKSAEVINSNTFDKMLEKLVYIPEEE